MLRIVDIFQYLILQYLIVGTLFWHQRIKVVSDLLVQLATVERQESRTKLQQECNRLGNVGVMRFEFLINNLNEFGLIAQLLVAPYSSSSLLVFPETLIEVLVVKRQ